MCAVLLNVIFFYGSIMFAGHFPSTREACAAASDFIQTEPKAYKAISVEVCYIRLRSNAVAATPKHI